MDFSTFYCGIREYFSSHKADFQEFSQASSGRDKVSYLASHPIVSAALKNLSIATVPAKYHSECKTSGQVVPVTGPHAESISQIIGALGKVSPTYPQMSAKVTVKSSAKKGRYLVANQKINPGELLIVERPFATVLYSEYYKSHCIQCFARLSECDASGHIKCQGCDQAIFCSQQCKDADQVHWAECGRLDLLQDEEIGKMALMVYRTFVRTGVQRLISVDMGEAKKPLYDSADYSSVYHQVPNEESREAGEMFKRCFMAFYIIDQLRIAGFLPPTENFFGTDETLTLVNLALRHLQSCSCNAYEIGEMVEVNGRLDENLQLGGAIYPTVSLSNHHCNANTVRNSIGNVCIVRAASTIYPGQEVADNYGHYFQVKPKADRQHDLKIQYFFDCDCQACRSNWPLYRNLPAEPAFVCSACKADINVTKKQPPKKCSKCKKEIKNLAKLQRVLSTFHTDVTKALSETSGEQADCHLSQYLQTLALMEPWLKQPSKQFIVCQQVISECYAYKANLWHSNDVEK